MNDLDYLPSGNLGAKISFFYDYFKLFVILRAQKRQLF